MKGMNILCASQASTAIRSSTEQPSASASNKRFNKTLSANLCTSHPPPLNPLPYHQLRHNQKTSSERKKKENPSQNPSPTNNSSLNPSKNTCSESDIKDADTGNDKIQSVQQDQPPSTNHQVVVLKVSLHCKGCEGKVRKHLSRLEGVTSFSIDPAAKKVTIVGDVTPGGVLESVSKVKMAKFWTNQK